MYTSFGKLGSVGTHPCGRSPVCMRGVIKLKTTRVQKKRNKETQKYAMPVQLIFLLMRNHLSKNLIEMFRQKEQGQRDY